MPVCLVGFGLLVAGIWTILRTIRVPELARLPLVAGQDVEFEDSGPIACVVDKPRLREDQAGLLASSALSVILEDSVTGHRHAAEPASAPFIMEGPRRTRLEAARLASLRPGRYRARIAGLAAVVEGNDCFLVFARPVATGRFIGGILVAILCGFLAVGGLVLSILVGLTSGGH